MVLLLLLVAWCACGPPSPPPEQPRASSGQCGSDNVEACETALAQAVALGQNVGELGRAYAAARAAKDASDAFALAYEQLKAAIGDSGVRAAAGRVPGDDHLLKDDPTVAEFETADLAPVGKTIPAELLYVVLAESAGLDYLAVARKDGSLVRAFGRDPLVPWMAGATPVSIDAGARARTATRKIGEDAALERQIRAAFGKAADFDYVGASDHIDAIDSMVEKRDRYDAQTLRSLRARHAIGVWKPAPITFDDPPAVAPEPAPTPTDTAYYDLLRLFSDRPEAMPYEQRRAHLLAGVAEEMRPLLDRMWGDQSGACTVTLPPAFDQARDIGFAYLLPQAILPAGAKDVRGRLPLADWYPRYEKLIALVERTRTAYFAVNMLVVERGGASSIIPTGSDANRRVDILALKHTRALEALAKAKPGYVGIAQLGFLGSPGGDDNVHKAVNELARVAAQGSLANAHDGWEVLLNTAMGVILSGNMAGDIREQHLVALAGAFAGKLGGELRSQTGWGVASAYAADLVHRSLTDRAPDPAESVAQIARALETDPKIAQPGIASLVSALVRYAALAAEGNLGPAIVKETDSAVPSRTAARKSLRDALVALGPEDKPDPRLLNELTTLADNAAATLALAITSSVAKPKTEDKSAQCDKDEAGTDPRIVNALGKLRDQRRGLLQSKTLAAGTDKWSKRARLVAVLLSDLVDVVGSSLTPPKPKKANPKAKKSAFPSPMQTTFFVAPAEAEKAFGEGLDSFGADTGVQLATQSFYALARGFLTDGVTYLAKDGAVRARDLLLALSPLVAEPGASSKEGGGLLLALASVLGTNVAPGDTPGYVKTAGELYDQGRTKEADTVLLAAVVTAAVTGDPIWPELFDLASAKKSSTAWLFDFLKFSKPAGQQAPITSLAARPRFQQGLETMMKEHCAQASSSTIADVLDAVERFKSNTDRPKALADLDTALEKGAADLTLPHVSFTFVQETRTRALNLSIDVALAAPFVSSTGGFNVGGGFKSAGTAQLALKVGVDTADAKRTRDDSARYYVQASATSAALHFLAGEPAKAERSIARALGAVTQRSWLYTPGITDEPGRFAEPSLAMFALVAQQAIDTGRPFLAGVLLQIIRASVDPATARTKDFVAILDELPKPLLGLAEMDPLAERARSTLALIGGGLACGGPRLDKAVFLRPSCSGYPLAIALRLTDSIAAMPALTAGKKASSDASCAAYAAIDGFLVPAQNGKYEPDRILDAVDHLLEQNKIFDATFLLTRPRDPAHCGDRIVQQMRKANDQLTGVPPLRADLLTAIVNCEVGGETAVLSADLAALDTELLRVGDPSRQIQIGLFAAVLAMRRNEPALVESIVKKAGFLPAHREHGPLLPIALMLDHVTSALAGKEIDVQGTQRDMDFLCGLNDLPAGPDTCKTLRQLREPNADAAARKRIAEGVLSKMSPSR